MRNEEFGVSGCAGTHTTCLLREDEVGHMQYTIAIPNS